MRGWRYRDQDLRSMRSQRLKSHPLEIFGAEISICACATTRPPFSPKSTAQKSMEQVTPGCLMAFHKMSAEPPCSITGDTPAAQDPPRPAAQDNCTHPDSPACVPAATRLAVPPAATLGPCLTAVHHPRSKEFYKPKKEKLMRLAKQIDSNSGETKRSKRGTFANFRDEMVSESNAVNEDNSFLEDFPGEDDVSRRAENLLAIDSPPPQRSSQKCCGPGCRSCFY
ncbi:unnamed protein product [Ranitomeya imitator]|uniref:Uncharacterized protein n=1 Tax=Ranitomeya imitator TaxID=111125 RepID=A0ABN9LPG7_9NEOB|nr:unnamed protein product [Ranitomeya imitator]